LGKTFPFLTDQKRTPSGKAPLRSIFAVEYVVTYDTLFFIWKTDFLKTQLLPAPL
jgi:hypothetical protein